MNEEKIRNCQRNLAAFTEFVALRQKPALHHVHLIKHLEAVERGEIKRLMVFMPPGSAKALALDTPIPTPTGWKRMGDLRVGDQVFGDDGRPCNVTWVSPIHVNRPIYTVRTDCGDEVVADRDHEWLVRLCGKPRRALKSSGKGRPAMAGRDDAASRFKIKETWELARRRAKRPMIAKAGALVLPDADLPVDPYLLGVWLGDGTSASMAITSSANDMPWLRGEIERLGYATSTRSAPNLFGVLGVRDKFVAMGLVEDPHHGTHGRKHIPGIYLRSSIAQRKALLQGLIDTDGTVCRSRGCSTFTNTNLELAENVRELVRSLGIKAGWSEGRATLNGKDCGPVYRISFYCRDAARMPRKAALCRDQKRTPNTYIDVESAGFADTVCIEVDSASHLFLCGRSMTPTHNSSYATIGFPAWVVGRQPKVNVIAASHTTTLAERFGRRVRNIVGSEEFGEVFATRLAHDSQSASRWGTTEGGEYMAAGVGAAIVGFRADLGILDDPIAGREQADSEIEREKAYQWYLNDFWTRLKPGAAVVLIMQRWHEDDLAGRLLKDMARGGEKWHVVKLAMEAGEDDPLGRAPGEPLWAEWFTDEMRAQARRDARAWSALYQQEPRPAGGGEFKREWIQRYRGDPTTSNKVIIVDPAGERKPGQKGPRDNTAIGVIGLGVDRNYYLVEGYRDRLNLTERTNLLFELHEKHQPYAVGYERYGKDSDIEYIKSQQDARHYRFPIVELGGSLRKEDRIRRLIPDFEDGRWYLPKSMHRTLASGETVDVIERFIEEEYLPFPVGTRDDFIDMLSRIKDMTERWPKKRVDVVDSVPAVASWESI